MVNVNLCFKWDLLRYLRPLSFKNGENTSDVVLNFVKLYVDSENMFAELLYFVMNVVDSLLLSDSFQ